MSPFRSGRNQTITRSSNADGQTILAKQQAWTLLCLAHFSDVVVPAILFASITVGARQISRKASQRSDVEPSFPSRCTQAWPHVPAGYGSKQAYPGKASIPVRLSTTVSPGQLWHRLRYNFVRQSLLKRPTPQPSIFLSMVVDIATRFLCFTSLFPFVAFPFLQPF
jgi:hypothetical protein